jgi:hypothetical protein
MEKVGRSGAVLVDVQPELPAASNTLGENDFKIIAEIPSSWKRAALWLSFAGFASSGPSKPGTPDRPSNGRPKSEVHNAGAAKNSWVSVQTNPQLVATNATQRTSALPGKTTRTEESMVEACRILSAIDHDFGIIVEQKFDSKYWKKVEFATYVPQDGVKPSEALRHLLSNKDGYKYECATGLVLALHTALLLRDGDEAFNKVAHDLKIGPWEMSDGMWAQLARKSGTGGDRLAPEDWKHISVGAVLYIKNPWVTGYGYLSAMQGQNAILCGFDKDGEALLWGHPFGIVKESEIVAKLSDSQYWFAEQPYYTNSWKTLR